MVVARSKSSPHVSQLQCGWNMSMYILTIWRCFGNHQVRPYMMTTRRMPITYAGFIRIPACVKKLVLLFGVFFQRL